MANWLFSPVPESARTDQPSASLEPAALTADCVAVKHAAKPKHIVSRMAGRPFAILEQNRSRKVIKVLLRNYTGLCAVRRHRRLISLGEASLALVVFRE